VNNHGGFDRWAFVEVWDAKGAIRQVIADPTILVEAAR
jgi:hypothetical protein